MGHTLVMMFVSVVSGQFLSDEGQNDEIASLIASNGYKKIAVCPYVVHRGKKTDFFGDLNKHARELSRRTERMLISQSAVAKKRGESGFVVVPSETLELHMQEAGVTYTALLKDAQTRWGIAGETRADALVLIYGVFEEDERNREYIELELKLYELPRKKPRPTDDGVLESKGIQVERSDVTLSDAVQLGRSFEARRWDGDRLDLVDLSSRLNPESKLDYAFAYGLEAERRQFQELLAKRRQHPLAGENAASTVIRVLVQGKEREPVSVDDKLYVRLDAGERYEIELANNSNHAVLFGIFVDGINTIRDAQEAEHPYLQPAHCHWAMGPEDRTGVVEGWYHHQTAQLGRFRVGGAAESVAGGKGVYNQLGMITAVVYTNGIEGITPEPWHLPPPPGSKGATVEEGIGTAEDPRQDADLQLVRAKKGLMLAAMTLHYRDSEWFEDHQP
jgi:hypothetical protein